MTTNANEPARSELIPIGFVRWHKRHGFEHDIHKTAWGDDTKTGWKSVAVYADMSTKLGETP